ncbi:hypothetical protein ABW21_db0207582 [Orbilia brochopaga]|nr:hypothetical protein ABW21_db0207582 [Drechslerella brochopaga]
MPSTHNALGLTAVILCGEGTALKPILSSPKFPKALLPVANRPMIQYPLEWLLDGGITSIIIVCMQGQEAPIEAAIKKIYEFRASEVSRKLPPLPEVIGAAAPGKGVGTADVFRLPQVYNLIKNDFMVVACDSVCEVPAAQVIKEWMLLPENLGSRPGGISVWYNIKRDKGTERDVVLVGPVPRYDIDPGLRTFEARTDKTAEMCYLLEHFGSFMDHPDHDINWRNTVYLRHPRVAVQTAWRDGHIYIFPEWALRFIRANHKDKLHSIKNDVLNFIGKAGWQSQGIYSKKIGLHQIVTELRDHSRDQDSIAGSTDSVPPGGLTETDIDNFVGFSSTKPSTWPTLPTEAKDRKEINTRGWFPTPTKEKDPSPAWSPTGSGDGKHKRIKMPFFNGLYVPGIAIFKPQMDITPIATKPLIRRVDTLSLYLSTCLELARNPVVNTQPISQDATLHLRANVSSIDSIVGEKTQVDEKVIVKRSVVGKHCHIGKMTRIQGSVVLDSVKIGAGVKLEGCVLGRFVKIGPGAQLTNCQVAEGVFLRDGTVEKDKLITESSLDSSSDDDIFGGSNDGELGSGSDDDEDEDQDSDGRDYGKHDDEDEDGSSEDDDKTTESVPTTTRESATPISSALSTSHTANVPPAGPSETVVTETSEPKSSSDQIKEKILETEESVEHQAEGDDDEETEDGGLSVPFLQLAFGGESEDEQDDEGDFEPDNDDSSFCEEEYDSNFESDGLASGDDAGNLSGPELDGGPLKSPKRTSRTFTEEMKKNLLEIVGFGQSSDNVGRKRDHVEEEEDGSKPTEAETAKEMDFPTLAEDTTAIKDDQLEPVEEVATINHDQREPVGGIMTIKHDLPESDEETTTKHDFPKPIEGTTTTVNYPSEPYEEIVIPQDILMKAVEAEALAKSNGSQESVQIDGVMDVIKLLRKLEAEDTNKENQSPKPAEATSSTQKDDLPKLTEVTEVINKDHSPKPVETVATQNDDSLRLVETTAVLQEDNAPKPVETSAATQEDNAPKPVETTATPQIDNTPKPVEVATPIPSSSVADTGTNDTAITLVNEVVEPAGEEAQGK